MVIRVLVVTSPGLCRVSRGSGLRSLGRQVPAEEVGVDWGSPRGWGSAWSRAVQSQEPSRKRSPPRPEGAVSEALWGGSWGGQRRPLQEVHQKPWGPRPVPTPLSASLLGLSASSFWVLLGPGGMARARERPGLPRLTGASRSGTRKACPRCLTSQPSAGAWSQALLSLGRLGWRQPLQGAGPPTEPSGELASGDRQLPGWPVVSSLLPLLLGIGGPRGGTGRRRDGVGKEAQRCGPGGWHRWGPALYLPRKSTLWGAQGSRALA